VGVAIILSQPLRIRCSPARAAVTAFDPDGVNAAR
jgi:hypothetical protein